MVEFGVVKAGNQCALAYPARIEAYDVEVGSQLGAEMRWLTGLGGIALPDELHA